VEGLWEEEDLCGGVLLFCCADDDGYGFEVILLGLNDNWLNWSIGIRNILNNSNDSVATFLGCFQHADCFVAFH
jgi:hypothetical protein